MKKIFTFFSSLFLSVILAVGCSCHKIEKFHLEDKYYTTNTSGFVDIKSYDTIQTLINNEESFIVYVHSFTCAGCQKFTPILESFLHNNNLTIYRITITDVKETSNIISNTKGLATPSLFLFDDGKYIIHLDPNEKDHTSAYKDENGLKDWLSQYIYLQPEND